MSGCLEPWPPYCCVPAFVDSALRQLNLTDLARDVLARKLEVTVPGEAANPWSLRLADSAFTAGLTPSTAVRSVNRLLAGLSTDARLRHLPFSTIAMKLYEDVAAEALRRNVVVGVGLDWNGFSQTPGTPRRHILRLLAANSQHVRLIDDSLGSTSGSFDCAWEVIENSVGIVDDGFWLIGSPATLQFAATGPWLAP